MDAWGIVGREDRQVDGNGNGNEEGYAGKDGDGNRVCEGARVAALYGSGHGDGVCPSGADRERHTRVSTVAGQSHSNCESPVST